MWNLKPYQRTFHAVTLKAIALSGMILKHHLLVM